MWAFSVQPSSPSWVAGGSLFSIVFMSHYGNLFQLIHITADRYLVSQFSLIENDGTYVFLLVDRHHAFVLCILWNVSVYIFSFNKVFRVIGQVYNSINYGCCFHLLILLRPAMFSPWLTSPSFHRHQSWCLSLTFLSFAPIGQSDRPSKWPIDHPKKTHLQKYSWNLFFPPAPKCLHFFFLL